MRIMFWMVIFSVVCKLSFSEVNAREPNIRTFENAAINNTPKIFDTYIIHLNSQAGFNSVQSDYLESLYTSFIPQETSGLDAASRMVHMYRHAFNGFAARLTAEEAKEMQEKNGILFVRPQKMLTLHTTHSPSFLGLQQNFGSRPVSNSGKGIIIGMLDGGITPDHPSFSDKGMPPPPARWRGKCELNGSECNNKLIGARNFVSEKPGSAIDEDGHGTHVASIAAGNFVEDANIFGNANGTAVGMAPLAHLAIYKVCTELQCAESDILAGMEATVQDGVDVISASFGGISSIAFPHHVLSVGAFHAIQKGILVSCSAGNNGPFTSSVVNDAPWLLTVGASTINRNIWAIAQLDNGVGYLGQSVFQPKDFPKMQFPLVYAGAHGDQNAAFCEPGSLNNTNVGGKIVVCDRGEKTGSFGKGQTVKDAEGTGMILTNLESDGDSTKAEIDVLPSIHVTFSSGKELKAYINSSSTFRASIDFQGTMIGVENAPMVASFSSRGPSLASPGILKPDIIGPGVSILAAWPLSVENKTSSKSTFNFMSGTSTSCPHLSGIAALIKSAHPDWSPAAIKSALMTTADTTNRYDTKPIFNERLQPADVFAMGAGQVNPTKALDPGLVYDIQPDDYIPYLCSLGNFYNNTNREIELIVNRPVECSTIKSISEAELNYHSFSIHLGSADLTYSRTVTNVGEANSVYYVTASQNPGFVIGVDPFVLNFTEVNQKLTYNVTFIRDPKVRPEQHLQKGLLR